MNKTYLGDGVYIEQISDGFVLTTFNGLETTNLIILENNVADELVKYIKRFTT